MTQPTLAEMKQRSFENRITVFRRPFYYVPLEQNVGWVANPTCCEIEQFCWVLTQPTLAEMKQRSFENRITVFRRPFYYVPLEQNVGWVANPTCCEIEQFCWVLTQPTLANL